MDGRCRKSKKRKERAVNDARQNEVSEKSDLVGMISMEDK